MDIFGILDPDPYENLCGSETLLVSLDDVLAAFLQSLTAGGSQQQPQQQQQLARCAVENSLRRTLSHPSNLQSRLAPSS